MKDKKFLAKLIAVILVVSMLCVGMFACKKDEEPKPEPKPEEQEAYDAVTPLVNAVVKSLENGDMEDLVVSGELGLGLKNGNNTSNYKISLDLDLNLYNGSNEESNTSLQAEIKDGDSIIFGMYYYDYSTENQGSDAFADGKLYMQYKDGTAMKKIAITVPQVNATMKALDAKVDFSKIDLSNIDISSAATILSVVSSITEVDATDNTKFTINLTNVLNNFADILGGIDLNSEEMPLGIALKGSELATILPEIEIVIDYDLKSNGHLDKLDVNLKLSDKDIIINKVDNKPLLVVGMNGAVEVNPTLKFAVNNGTVTGAYDDPVLNKTESEYVNQSLINAQVSIGLKVDQDIAVKVMDGLKINLKADTYKATLKVDADPTVILGKLFSYVPATEYAAGEIYFEQIVKDKLYVRAANVTAANVTNYYVRVANLGFGGFGAILDTVSAILGCVNALELEIAGSTAENVPLKLYAAKNSYGELKITIEKLGLVTNNDGGALISGSLSNLGIQGLIDAIKPVIINLVGADEANNTAIFKTIAGYLTNAYIGLFADNAESLAADYKKPGAHAEIKIDNIPFSGYTQFKGAYNSNYDYYKMTAQAQYKEVSITEFAKDTTYYTYDAQYSKVDTDLVTAPKEGVDYYTTDGKTYTKVIVSAWEKGVTYYTMAMVYNQAAKYESGKTYYTYEAAKYTKANVTSAETFDSEKAASVDGKLYVGGSDVNATNPFGIGLDATLDITKANGLVLNATVKGMDFIGLAPTLTVKISNVSGSLFTYNYPTWEQITAA